MEKHITTPLTDEKVRDLHAGDYVYLSGTVYTARDAAHKRMYEAMQRRRRNTDRPEQQHHLLSWTITGKRRTGYRIGRTND